MKLLHLPVIPLNGAIALPSTKCELLIGRDFSTKALSAVVSSKSSYVILLGHESQKQSNHKISIESMHSKGVLAKLKVNSKVPVIGLAVSPIWET